MKHTQCIIRVSIFLRVNIPEYFRAYHCMHDHEDTRQIFGERLMDTRLKNPSNSRFEVRRRERGGNPRKLYRSLSSLRAKGGEKKEIERPRALAPFCFQTSRLLQREFLRRRWWFLGEFLSSSVFVCTWDCFSFPGEEGAWRGVFSGRKWMNEVFRARLLLRGRKVGFGECCRGNGKREVGITSSWLSKIEVNRYTVKVRQWAAVINSFWLRNWG